MQAFALKNQRGDLITHENLVGKRTLLYFYPRDFSKTCTLQALAYMETLEAFADRGVRIVGISRDSVDRHERFAATCGITYDLLADTDAVLHRAFGVIKRQRMYGRSFLGVRRSTFLLDEGARILKSYMDVDVTKHVEEVLRDLEQFSG